MMIQNKLLCKLLISNCTNQNSKFIQRFFSTSSQFLPKIDSLSTSISSSNVELANSIAENSNNFSSLIQSDEIRRRQVALIKLIDKNLYHRHKSNVLVIPSSSRSFQADTKIPEICYKQNSDFTYLTGFTTQQTADCVLVIVGGNGEPIKSYLFTPEPTPERQLWDGCDVKDEHSNWLSEICDDLLNVGQMNDFIKSQNGKQFFVSKSSSNNDNNQDGSLKLNGNLPKLTNLKPFANLSNYIDQLRVIKSPSEIKAMKRSCQIGAQSMHDTMKWAKSLIKSNSNLNESQIAAHFDYKTKLYGAKKLSFPTVCGSGIKSTAIHYGLNNKFIVPSDWVLMDAGCEDVDGYNSDLTRTWPIDGNYRCNQVKYALYEALCDVQKDLIKTLQLNPTLSLDDLFKLMCISLGKVLIEFHIIDKTMSSHEAAATAFKYCPHHVSHYLGLDIHDTPTISRSIPLKPGMCFTIEPGLYFQQNDINLKSEFRGFGMRIEDDLIVDHSGKIEVLTKNCPHFFNV